jgi:trigger factor
LPTMAGNAEEYLKGVESPTDLKRILRFEVPRERVEREIDAIIKELRKDLSLPGFRKGKAPLDLVRSRFAETAKKEAIEKLIPEAYRNALDKESLRPVLPAEISSMEYGTEGPLSFEIAIELFPKIELDHYKGVKVKKETKPVEDADVERELEGLRQRLARFEKLEREAQIEDIVVMDYWRLGGDDRPVRGSRVTNYPAEIGGGGVVKDFDDALLGVSKGDNKTIDVTYPDDFPQEDLRGKQVRFGIEVKEVGRRVVPELDEELAKAMGLDSVEALKQKVQDGLKVAHEQEAIRKAQHDILSSVIEKSSFEVPDGLVNMGLESMMKSYQEEYERSGAPDVADKLDEIRERLRPLAINVVKEQFIIDDIAKRETIRVQEAEIEEVLKSVASQAGVSVDEARKRANESEQLDRWRRDILKRKVLDFLFEHAEIE